MLSDNRACPNGWPAGGQAGGDRGDRPIHIVLDMASRYLRRGWAVIPIPVREKRPTIERWQYLRLAESELPQYFNGKAQNIGVLLGEASGGLVDVDLDAEETLMLARYFLPRTGCIFGREGKPASHWLYRCDPLPPSLRFPDTRSSNGRTMLLELRSSGQTIFPPSIHPSGERIEWVEDGEPNHVHPDELARAVRKLAAAALLVRHYPSKGERHNTSLALAGALLRAGWPEKEATHFIFAVAHVAGDEETADRMRSVTTTDRRLDLGQPATGLPTLAAFVGKDVVDRLVEWLELGQPSAGRPEELEAIEAWMAVSVGTLPEPKPRAWLLPDLLPSGCLTIWYGDAGTFKSWLASALAVAVAAGRSFLGYPLEKRAVLYVDAELDVDEFTRRAYQLARGWGLGAPPGDLYYLRLPNSLALPGNADRLSEVVRALGVELTIVDSLTLASVGADLKAVEEVTRVLAALQQLGTVLLIDHIPKPLPGVNLSSYRPFGSMAKWAMGRHAVQVVRAESGEGVVLRPAKSNFGPLGQPIGVRVHFEERQVRFERADIGDEAFAGVEENLPALDRVFRTLAEYPEGVTPAELGEELGLSTKTVKNYLTLLRRQGRAETCGGRWRCIP